jgi:hypothetical protein
MTARSTKKSSSDTQTYQLDQQESIDDLAHSLKTVCASGRDRSASSSKPSCEGSCGRQKTEGLSEVFVPRLHGVFTLCEVCTRYSIGLGGTICEEATSVEREEAGCPNETADNGDDSKGKKAIYQAGRKVNRTLSIVLSSELVKMLGQYLSSGTGSSYGKRSSTFDPRYM